MEGGEGRVCGLAEWRDGQREGGGMDGWREWGTEGRADGGREGREEGSERRRERGRGVSDG